MTKKNIRLLSEVLNSENREALIPYDFYKIMLKRAREPRLLQALTKKLMINQDKAKKDDKEVVVFT